MNKLQKLLSNWQNLSSKEAEKLIKELDNYYYKENKPFISDSKYDEIKLYFKDIVNSGIGDDLNKGFPKYSHSVPMLSLDNTYSVEELNTFLNRVSNELNIFPEFTVEPKIDGLALSIIYKDGKLHKAITRGNGTIGDDVSRNLHMFKSLPLELSKNVPKFIELRGEAFLTWNQFSKINEQQKTLGLEEYANPRNLASGTLKSIHASPYEKELSIYIYSFGKVEGIEINSQKELFSLLDLWKIPHITPTLLKNKDSASSLIENFNSKRTTYDFPTDGLVFKVNEFSYQNELGSTSKYPKWAIAYKFAAEKAETTLLSLDIQVGRTGVLTPIAVLEPVSLSGTTVSRCSLHNWSLIKEKDIRINDSVVVEKAGEIIPQVVEVNYSSRVNSIQIIEPTHCPSCNQLVSRKDGEVAIRCTNTKCPARVQANLEYFVSKDSLNIYGMGPSLLKQLIENKLISKRSDIYKLTQEQLVQLDKVKEKKASKCIESIKKSISSDPSQLLTSLGIPLIGKIVSRKLLSSFSLEDLPNLSTEQITQIDGMGEEIANSLITYFKEDIYKDELMDFINIGFSPSEKKEKIIGPLTNTSFVITGTLSKSRSVISQELESLGASVQGTITSSTTHLLAGDKAGSKIDKARKKGIQIVDEKYLNSFTKAPV